MMNAYILTITIISIVLIVVILIAYRLYRSNQKKNIQLEKKNRELKEQRKTILSNADRMLINIQELLSLNTQKDKFYTVISHDLRGFVSTIKGFVDLLKQTTSQEKDERTEKYLSLISKAADSTLNLLNNLLEWSRTQQGQSSFKPENLDLYEMVNNALFYTEPMAEKKMISMVNEIKQDTLVFGDKGMIFTVFRNLISNAIKFTEPGGTITVYSKREKDIFKIHVKDTGVGITKENLQKLFKKDQVFSTLDTDNEQGTGIGLLLCKEFMDDHDQSIGVKSTPGKGSDFWFTLKCI